MSDNTEYLYFREYHYSLILALFTYFKKRNMNQYEKYLLEPTENIWTHIWSEVFPFPRDIVNLFNGLLEWWWIEEYKVLMIKKSDQDISKKISLNISIGNKEELFQYRLEEYFIEFYTQNESKRFLDSIIKWYIKMWINREFHIYQWNFMSVENQKFEVNNHIRKQYRDCWDNTLTISERKIWERIEFNEYTEMNIDILGVLLYLEENWYIEIQDININKMVDYKVNIKKLHPIWEVKFLWIDIELSYEGKFINIKGKRVDLDTSNRQHIFVLILLYKFGNECDLEYIEKQFQNQYSINLKNEKRKDVSVKDEVNQIYRNLWKERSSLKEIYQHISKTHSNWYKLW